jgi:hypothetical protein
MRSHGVVQDIPAISKKAVIDLMAIALIEPVSEQKRQMALHKARKRQELRLAPCVEVGCKRIEDSAQLPAA